jgi:glycosyltransferase involved in cell wall biosynthesis
MLVSPLTGEFVVVYYKFMTVVHVLQPFASGVTTAVINITKELPDIQHVVVHGVHMRVDAIENVKGKFPRETRFIEWKHADREISVPGDFRALRELIAILKPCKNKDTVIHLHSSKAGFLGRLACGLLGIRRLIYTPHCASFLRTDISPGKKRLFRFLEKTAGVFGGRVVGCGKAEAEIYSQLGKMALFVPNGVEITPLVKDREPRLVSFSGIAGPQKDPALFNRIAAAFQDEGLPFCWIGDGPLRDELRAKNIELTGWINKDRIDPYLRGTLVYLSTAAWEGLPFGVLEAMNASCALLLRDVPGNRELVIPGENGYLFSGEGEGTDLLRKMIEDREKTLAMGKKSREIAAAAYSVKKMGEGYGKIYTALINDGELICP